MMPRIKPPRLLPITIFALAGLLAMKSVDLVRGAAAAAVQSQPAIATAQAATPATPEHQPPAVPSAQPVGTPAADDSAPPIVDGERTVLLELRQRRQELDSRESVLTTRASLLTATEQKLSGRVAELQALQKKLEALETSRQEREDTSWQRLVKLYETMKPRDAATIFNELDMPVLLQVVDRMKESKAAPVLAAMQPDKARDVTTQIARIRTGRDSPGTNVTGG
jgi:flagellar motility protein MotE (MotC chaperone)